MAQTIKLKRSGTSGAIPTTSQLELGEVAINTYDGKMYIKKNVGGTESIVEVTVAAADAIVVEYQFTATANQTTFSGSDDNSETLSYSAGAVQIFLNGILLDSGVDYTATNGTSIVLSEVVDANDYLQVFAFKKKISNGQTTVDTFTGDNSTTAFTLSLDPGDENNTRVYIDGVYQSKSNYSVSGTTLTFSTAPPTSTAIEVEIGNRVVTLDTLSDLDLPDNVKLRLGTSQDADFYHDGTDTYLRNQTGQLLIRGNDTKLQSYLGETYATFANNGAATLYYDNSAKLATTSTGVTVTGNIANSSGDLTIDVAGDVTLDAGGGDIIVADDGTEIGRLKNVASGFQLQSSASNKDLLFVGSDAGVDVTALTLDMSAAGTAIFNSHVDLSDSKYLRLGNDADFIIYHDGSTNYVQAVKQDSDIIFRGNDGGTNFNALTLDMSDVGTAHFNGHIRLGDNRTASFGAGYDIEITSDGTHGTIGAPNGNLKLDVASSIILDSDAGNVYLRDHNTDVGLISMANTDLYIRSLVSNRDIIFQGYDAGVNITALTLDMSDGGTAILASHLDMGDNQKIRLGASDDLQLFHDGSNSYIQNGTTGNINITNTAGGEFVLVGVANGGTFLYHDGTSKFQTTSTGVDVTGTITADGLTVDAALATINAPSNNADLVLTEGGTNTDARIRNSNGILEIDADLNNEFGNSSILFAVDGTDRLKINNNGNVGIGTAAPDAKIHATGTQNSGDVPFIFENSATSGVATSSIVFAGNGGGGAEKARIKSAVYGDGYMAFHTNDDTEKMRIDASGNVGIGTDSPDTLLHLSAPSTSTSVLRFESTDTSLVTNQAVGVLEFEQNDGTSVVGVPAKIGAYAEDNHGSVGLRFYTGVGNTANEVVRFDHDGNVGIGAAPQTTVGTLDLVGNASNYSTSPMITFRDTSGQSTARNWSLGNIAINYGDFHIGCGDTNSDYFDATAHSKFTIKSSGNVGIGTTSPNSYSNQTTLTINGSVYGRLDLESAGTLRASLFATTGSATLYTPTNILSFDAAGGEAMRIDSSRNLLVGLSSSLTNGKLQIAGGIGLSGNTQIRQATNSDGNTLQVFATQLVAGSNNSSSYNYTGGGLLASLSNLDSAVILDAGRQTSTGGRFKVVTTSSSNTSLYLEKNGTYTLYADTGSGNVGIGTTSPAQKLHVVGTSRPALIGSDNAVNIVKLYNSATGSTTYNGLDLLVNSTSDSQINSYGMPLTFGTSSSNGTNVTERMRINASGDWMVGNTVPNVSSNYNNQAGCGWVESDHHFEIATTNNRSALEVSKNNANDGEIITFRKQGNVVGRLGTFGTDLYIGQNNSGLRFEYAGLDAIVPFDADSVAINDNVITLGHANARFKDLHLSGTSYTNQVELAEISTSNSDVPNDIFIYDTRKDSDGGAWRYRTQHTTWYNETLSTSTRGARKEFPAVAVIIVESDQLTIYDGDDPDMPMWMVFNAGSDMSNETLLRGTAIRGAAMLNGILCVATADTLVYIRFIDEYHNLFHTSSEYFFPARTGIVDRNVVIAEPQQRVGGENGTYYGLASSGTKSVSMTVLPNAPIHPTCGLPIPTIGVACGTAGNSIIRHDGKVVDIISGDSTEQAEHAPVFLKDGRVAIQNYDDDRGWRIMNIPEENTTIQNHYNRGGDFVLEWYNSWSHAPASTQLGDITVRGKGVNPASVYIPLVEANEHIAIGHNDDGVSLVARQPDDPVNGMSAFIEKDYNTGWMPGATKLAMAPTDSTTFSSTEMITNGTFSNGTTGWSGGNATVSESGGVLTVTGTRTTGGNQTAVATVTGTTTPGEHYIVTFQIVEHVANQSSSGIIVGNGEIVENNHLHYWYPNTVGTHTTTIVATSTYLSLQLHAGTAVGVITKFDNVSLFRAEPDRSARHRATQLSGSVTRAAVATGAELRAYESFSTGNFMFQNYYNDELNFGTGDFAIACWVKAGNTNSYRRFISIQNPSGTQTDNDAINIKFSPSTNQYIYAYLGSTEGAINTPNVASDVWHHVVLTRRGNHYNMYLNGKLTDTMRSSQSKGSTNHKLYIGKGAEGNEVFTGGSITLIKIAKGTAPSSEQVARMYRDELCMFDENSNITLYGSDSGVRGLAHDDDTNLLHVGTPAGRSVFRGLRRVENTTAAVGATTNAAISASNGLVVENT